MWTLNDFPLSDVTSQSVIKEIIACGVACSERFAAQHFIFQETNYNFNIVDLTSQRAVIGIGPENPETKNKKIEEAKNKKNPRNLWLLYPFVCRTITIINYRRSKEEKKVHQQFNKLIRFKSRSAIQNNFTLHTSTLVERRSTVYIPVYVWCAWDGSTH